MTRHIFLARAAMVLAVTTASAETHDLKLEPTNVHWGYYDARLKPVLRIASGDSSAFRKQKSRTPLRKWRWQ